MDNKRDPVSHIHAQFTSHDYGDDPNLQNMIPWNLYGRQRQHFEDLGRV